MKSTVKKAYEKTTNADGSVTLKYVPWRDQSLLLFLVLSGAALFGFKNGGGLGYLICFLSCALIVVYLRYTVRPTELTIIPNVGIKFDVGNNLTAADFLTLRWFSQNELNFADISTLGVESGQYRARVYAQALAGC